MMSPGTRSVRTLLGSSGTLKVGWKSSCRLRAGGRPVRVAKEGWSAKSGAATRAPTGEGEMEATGVAAPLLQATSNAAAIIPEARPPIRPAASRRAPLPPVGEGGLLLWLAISPAGPP